jgi:hypothetical protein
MNTPNLIKEAEQLWMNLYHRCRECEDDTEIPRLRRLRVTAMQRYQRRRRKLWPAWWPQPRV